MDREALLRRYRELVLDELPRRARAQGWVVVHDHCLGRIVLDNTLGGRWYDVLDRRRSPAFAQLDDVRLAAAVALAERIAAEGDALLRELDARSLAWRGKAPRRPGGDDRPWPVPPTRTPPRSPASRGRARLLRGRRDGRPDPRTTSRPRRVATAARATVTT